MSTRSHYLLPPNWQLFAVLLTREATIRRLKSDTQGLVQLSEHMDTALMRALPMSDILSIRTLLSVDKGAKGAGAEATVDLREGAFDAESRKGSYDAGLREGPDNARGGDDEMAGDLMGDSIRAVVNPLRGPGRGEQGAGKGADTEAMGECQTHAQADHS
jgi:hypothetical protein